MTYILTQLHTQPQDHVGPVHKIFRFLAAQASAALFGILLMGAIIATRFWYPDWAPVTRYDALVIFAVGTQIALIALKLETLREALVIAIFHAVGTAMEVFKLAQGSWDYPETGVLELGGVPLFTGFMYAAIGSYIARSMRIFEIRVTPYPPFWVTLVLAVLIYGNFYAHHYLPDIRLGLFAATILLFWRTQLYGRLSPGPERRIWLPLAALATAILVWIAENVGTFTQTWTYPGQGQFDLVSLRMLGSWYLLLYVSFVTVTLVFRENLGLAENLRHKRV
ncbi:MAG: DUF817 domain-containing protein [Pseudomonadota bacterium]